jgi:outer membrane biosynthesis protein TonB
MVETPAPEPQPEPAPAPDVKPEPSPAPQAEAQAPEPSGNGKPAKAPKVKVPKAKAPPPACLCGCGATTGGGRFVAGHDAKLKSALLKAFRAEGLSAEQQALVEQLDWGRFLTPAPAGNAGPSAVERARAALARLSDAERAELLAGYAVPVTRL